MHCLSNKTTAPSKSLFSWLEPTDVKDLIAKAPVLKRDKNIESKKVDWLRCTPFFAFHETGETGETEVNQASTIASAIPARMAIAKTGCKL